MIRPVLQKIRIIYGDSMKTFKIIILSILSIFLAGYLAFLFILPNLIDLNKYSHQIKTTIQKTTGLNADFEGLNIQTAWDLSIIAFINKADLKYPTGEKFSQINGLQIKLPLFPLLFHEVKINHISADKILANLKINNNGEFLLKNYLSKNSPNNSQSIFHFSSNMPDIIAKKYRISFINGVNNYTLKGNHFEISDFISNKRIKLKTNGELILNQHKQISYDISIFSQILPKNKKQKINITQIFENLYKYNVSGNIFANLKIKDKKDYTDINGKINIDGISFVFGQKTFPKSTLKLDFSGNKTKIDSMLNIDKNSKATISGLLRNGKNKFIDLHVDSDKINLQDIIFLAKAMSNPFGIKNIQNISANGFLKADFSLKSNFKKIQSNGYLKIENASIINKLHNISLNSIDSNIDFSQDMIKINKTTANLSGQPIIISGEINKNANANISIIANNLQLKHALSLAGQHKLADENDITGIISLNALLKGQLNKMSPDCNITINNVDLKNKKTKTRVKLTKALVHMKYSKESKGQAEVSNIKVISNMPAVISIPKLTLIFDKNNLNIEKTFLYLNNIKANLNGKITNLNTNPRLNSVNISIPNEVSMSITGYAGSNINLKGGIILNGYLYKPQIKGGINIPLINIPSLSVSAKNASLQFNEYTKFNCPQLQLANSLISLNAQIDNNFSRGIVAKNVDFSADNIDLNYLIPVLRNIVRNPNNSIKTTILNGKSSITRFRAGRVVSTNITSDISLKNNILYLNNLIGDSYFGKIRGDISYDFANKKTRIDMQGRGLSANPALTALTGKNDDIKGQLDFDSNIIMSGYSKNELLKSLQGNTNFIISNGQMGVLGKFEHLLYAQNIISNNIFKATLNLVAKALTVKNTGVYKYMKGQLAFSNGWANIHWIKTSGPSMSLYITGRYYLTENIANLTILGRISDDVVRILGPIGEFSVDKAIANIPKIGEISSFIVGQFTVNPNYENTSEIPYLSPKTEFKTKEFKVVIDGEVHKQSSVKSFKWISSPKIVNQEQAIHDVQPQTPPASVPDFVNKLPDFKP